MDYHLPLLLALAASTYAGPAGLRTKVPAISSCSQTCTGSTKFNYAPGSTYRFKYSGETRTSMLGASEDHSLIGISALIDIEILSKCEHVLQLHDVSISAHDSKRYADQDLNKKFAQTLEKYPLRYSFQDGRLDSVCPQASEESWAVNIKKGILSTLQNSMDSFDLKFKGTESDITGQCDTQYEVTQRGWRSLNIKKTKDLSTCSHRQGFDSAIQTTPFRVSSGMKSLPIMKSSHTCDQEVSTSGTLTRSVCHEMHVLRPFSKDNSGATTEITQTMTFVQEKRGTLFNQAECGDREEMYFKHAPSDVSTDLGVKEASDLLRDLCDTASMEVTPVTSRQFSGLVSTMKRIDFTGLRRVYNQVMKDRFCAGNQEHVKKFYLDAIPMVGTEGSIELMKTLISNSDVTGSQADMWLASMAFVHHPTKQMIKYVQELTGLPTLSTKVLLPLSVMVQSYCRVNPLCGQVQEVVDFIDILSRNIDNGCKVDQKNFKTIMMSLRALGNTGNAEQAIPALYSCISEKDNSMDIRVAAIQAFRQLPCAADRNNLMGIYRDITADSELRITAYLAVMKCPTPYTISQIQETLASEEVNQVGSFVWSHLTNLMESSDPDNKDVQNLLKDMTLNKEFDLDKMKFSRNYEGSFYVEKYNTGAKVDTNMIWSSKSFVPRSATLNLTLNLFGESMNLLEVGGRVEGLETFLESYFGPVGYFNDDTKGSNEIPDADPRSARLSIKKFKDIKKQSQRTIDQLRGAMYMRMFGSEVSYNMFGANNGVSEEFSNSDMLNFLQKLRNKESQQLDLMKNVMFLDSSYTLPTVVGLPLKLAVNGTASMAINVGGQMDMKDPKSSVIIEGNFEPSASIEIDSMMRVDAVVTSGGLKMTSTMYTNTGARGKIEITAGNIFDLTFEITKEKSEILDVKSAFFLVYNGVEKEQRMIQDGREERSTCTGDRLTRAAGIQFCASYSAPNTSSKPDAPNFPFTGPVSISVAMHRQDLPNGYKLEVKTIKTPVQTLFRFMSNTPGSKYNRAIGLDMVVQHEEKTLDIILTSPWKKANFKGVLIDTATVKGLTGNLDLDEGARIYNLDAKILIEKTRDHVTYTPQVSLIIPDWKNVQLSGTIKYILKKSLEADLLITGAQDVPINIQGSIMNTDTMIGAKGKVNFKEGEGYVFEVVTKQRIEEKKEKSRYMYEPRVYMRTPEEELVEFNATVTYISDKSLKAAGSLAKLTKTPFTMDLDLAKTEIAKTNRLKYLGRMNINGPKVASKLMVMHDSKAEKNIFTKMRWDYNFAHFGWKDTLVANSRVKMNLFQYKKNIKMTGTLNSARNNKLDSALSLNYASNRDKTNLEGNLKYGENMNQKTSKDSIDLTLEAKHKDEKSIEYVVDFKFPAQKVDLKITGQNEYEKKSMASRISIQYHPERTVSFGIHLHNRTDMYPNYAGELSIKLPQEREMSFACGFGKENDNKYISNLEFEIIKGRRTRIDTMLKIAIEKIYEFEVGVQLPDLEPVRLLGAYTIEDHGHSIEASYKKADNLYRIYMQGIYEEGKTGKMILDVTVPTRRVKFVSGLSSFNTEKHMLVDLQWDADKNVDDRFLTNVTYDFKSWDDFVISSRLYYPTRTIDFNMKHSSAARYITNIELSWSPEDQLEFNIIFRDDVFNGANRTELTVEFKSPFKGYEELGLAVSLIGDSAQYQTKSSVTWAKKKKVLVTATAKVPLDINSLDMVGTITTPFNQYETMTASIKHRLNDGLQSNIMVQWGKNRLALTTTGQLQYSRISRSFTGKLDLRTPFDELRVLLIDAQHNDDFRKFSTKIALETTKQLKQVAVDKYTVEMDVTHDWSAIILSNTGTMKITMPNDSIVTTWEISNQYGKSRAMIDIMPMRKNQFKLDISETHQMIPNRKISASFVLLIPTQAIQQMTINFDHEDKAGYVKTKGTVNKDNLEIMSANVNYINSLGSLELDSLIKSAYTEDVILKVMSAHSVMPYSGKFDLKWGETPYKISAVSSVYYNEFGIFDNSLTITLPVPNMSMISVKSKCERRGLNWNIYNEVTVEGQKVSLETSYRFDHVKLTSVSIKTSFPQFPGLDTSFKVDGSPSNFKGDADFTMMPYVNKISTDFNLAYYQGTTLSGAFNLNTPFPQYPYFKAKVNSNKMGLSRVSGFEVEYLPTQIVKVDANYRFTSLETLEGTVKIRSPYTQNQEVVTALTHIGNWEEFQTKAKITCDCFSKTVFTEATFSSKNGIRSTFDMQSPFRGYETVKWNFTHRGAIDDFSTKAEYETSGKKITFENVFNMKNDIEYQITFLTPFANITRTHLKFSHAGKFPNTKTHAEVAYNENMIASDFDLSHNDRSTRANAKVTTPFQRYENMRATITKSGSLNDFTAKAEFQHDQLWHSSLRHKFNGQDVLSSSTLKMPYLPGDVILTLNHTGKPLNFMTLLEYTLGKNYKSSGEVKFMFDLPNLIASGKTVTEIEKEKRVSAFSLENNYSKNKGNIDIATKLLGQVRESKVDVDFKFKLDICSKGTVNIPDCNARDFKMLSYLVVETPHPDFNYNKMFIEDIFDAANDKELTRESKFSFETPVLEKVTYMSSQTFSVSSEMYISKSLSKYTYGSQEIIDEETYENHHYQRKITTPFSGYELTNIDVNFAGNLFDKFTGKTRSPDVTDWNIDGSFTSSALSAPVRVTISGNADNSNQHLNSINTDLKVVYTSDKEITANYYYRPGTTGLKLRTPFSGYESADFETSYLVQDNLFDYSFSVSSSVLTGPVVFISHTVYELSSLELSYKFTSGFTNFTHLELDANRRYGKVIWEDQKRTKKEIYVEFPKWTFTENSDGVEANIYLTLTTPFNEFSDLKFNMEHRHFTAPIRAKEVILMQFNGKKYFDMEAEFGSLNKFSGSIQFREPRPMEYSFSTENEGESVSADLILNWNKPDKDSNFRLEFGLADSGDQNKEKKVFHVRITNPGRIVSLQNSFERTDDKLSGSGKISWDERDNQQVLYDFDFSKMTVRGSTLYSSDVKCTLPTRKIEMSGSYTDQQGLMTGTGTVLWDAGNDKNKHVQVKVTVSPYNVKKMAEVNVRLPNLNKYLSLSTELAVNDGSKLLDGQTVVKYSTDDKKAVLVKYNVQQDGSDLSAGWSLDHVATKTRVAMTSSLVTKNTLTTGVVQLKYDGTDKDMTALVLNGQLDTNNRQINIQLSSQDQSVELSGHVTSESPYSVTIETSQNRKPTWKTVWTVDTDLRTLEASMTYDDMKGQIITKSFFPNTTSLVSETSTHTSADTIQYGRLAAELHDRKLHAHLKWRPQLISEAASYGSLVLQQMSQSVSPVVESGMKDLGNLIVDKHQQISGSLQEELKPLSLNLEKEIELVQQDLRKMKKELKRMYKQNDLYMKTIEETYSGSVQSMLASYSVAIARLNGAYTKVNDMIEEISNKIETYQLKEQYNNIVNTISEGIKEGELIMTEKLETVFSTLTGKVQELSALYDETMTDVSNHFRKMLEVMIDEFTLAPYLKDVQAAYDDLVTTVGLSDKNKKEILKVITQVKEILLESMTKTTLVEKYKTLYMKTEEFVSQHVGDFMNNDDLKEINQAVLDLYEQVSWVYKYTEMDISLKDLIQKVTDTIRSKVMEEFNQLPIGILDLHKSKVIRFDPENGEIEFDLYLPIPMENFEELMKFKAQKYISKLQKMADKYFPRRDFCLWDFYYRLPHMPLVMRKDWVPPFDVFGTVSGKQHFTTFDGRHYDVAGLCSYILAQDMVNGNFSVVLKYTGGPKNLDKESIIALVAGKTVEMFQTYMVKVDGQPAEMPYRSDRLTIVRSGNTVTLDSTIGLTVISDFSRDYHIVGVSGWYYGKVGGLLGNIDGEQHNDYMNPAGEVEERTRKLLNSWEVDTTCKLTMEYVEEESKRRLPECAAVFNASSSSLRPCFLMVDPAMYEHSCNMNISALCNIATLYTKTCERYGIAVNIPNTCVKCQAHDEGEFTPDKTMRYEASSNKPLRNSMDVVFVVEERQCNRDISGKLKDVITRVEQTLTQSGSSDNRYSLVGYAGSSVVSHTMEGQLFNDATKFSMGLENLRYTNLGPITNPLSAVMYASSLPFRTAVKKTVILVSCSPCEKALGDNYYSLSSVLQTRDITLHVLRQSAFQLKTNRSPKSQIFGIDSTTLFTGQRKDSTEGFSDIDIPQDYCATLALGTNGSIFDSSHMLENNVRQQRQFMDNFGERVRQPSSQCQVCSCELDSTGAPYTSCRTCDSQPLYFKGVSDMMQKAVDYTNTLTQKVQALLF